MPYRVYAYMCVCTEQQQKKKEHKESPPPFWLQRGNNWLADGL